MNKGKLLPKMAFTNIKNNKSTYFPYIGASMFAVFTFFAFDILLRNDLLRNIPKATSAMMMLAIGFALLGIILLPFLYYINSFLIKRRKSELGLYSILGMEKKHIGMMMFLESLLLYLVVLAGAFILGSIFSRAIFLLLINLVNMPIEDTFALPAKAFADTMIFYAVVTGINLFVNLLQVGKAKPVELMSGSKKGEKQVKHIGFLTMLGAAATGCGYYIAITAPIDSFIFGKFFFSVALVICGTYYLFTAGSVFILGKIQKNKKLYYKPGHFINISGMLYRMKKNAASLANICIFSTMVIVTAFCTVAVIVNMEAVKKNMVPSDFSGALVMQSTEDVNMITDAVMDSAKKNTVTVNDYLCYQFTIAPIKTSENTFFRRDNDIEVPISDLYALRILSLSEFNRISNTQESLGQNEILFYSTGGDRGKDTVVMGEKEYNVKKELTESVLGTKYIRNVFGAEYYVIVPDEEVETLKNVYSAENDLIYCSFCVDGEKQKVDAFYEDYCAKTTDEVVLDFVIDNRADRDDVEGMYGGLIFIGIFYGLIFIICLFIIMYYKQIAEGYEDKKNFEIMQKVGMDDGEIKKTIKEQIYWMYTLPIIGAFLHTAVAAPMIVRLMAVLSIYGLNSILVSILSVCAIFTILYIFSYKRTAKTYYKIVAGKM